MYLIRLLKILKRAISRAKVSMRMCTYLFLSVLDQPIVEQLALMILPTVLKKNGLMLSKDCRGPEIIKDTEMNISIIGRPNTYIKFGQTTWKS